MSVRPFLFRASSRRTNAFTRTDLLMAVAASAVLAAVLLVPIMKVRAKARLEACFVNLHEIGHGVVQFAEEHGTALPAARQTSAGASWWWYKEEIKGYVGLSGPSSPNDEVFACPLDRGYSDPGPFWRNPRFDFSSYVFNGVTVDEAPNIAGRKLPTISQPDRTLLVMEWTAHAPLSWHRSKTGKANAPFYRDAESMVTFADGHADFIEIYYDGYNAAYTRDPIPGYAYKYSGD